MLLEGTPLASISLAFTRPVTSVSSERCFRLDSGMTASSLITLATSGVAATAAPARWRASCVATSPVTSTLR